ncbi:MAG: CPBP family intramembrane metalloprotease [Clostridiales bacterium]|nr:CPBP family intramembrane metalloprotease [Clostridiales bacterium]
MNTKTKMKIGKINRVYFELVWYVIVYVFVYCVFVSVMYPVGISEAAITAFSLFFAINHIRKREKKKYGLGFKEALGIKFVKLSRNDILMLVLMGIGLNFTVGGILNIIPSGISKSYTESYSIITATGSIYETVIVMAVVTPVLEEIFFRGIFQRKLCSRLGEGVGLIAAACVFGFMHFNIIWSIYAAIMGFILGAVCLYYKSALPGAAVHSFFNLISCGPLLLSKYERIYKYTFGNKVYVIVSFIVGIGILYFIFDRTWIKNYFEKNLYIPNKGCEVAKNEET